MKYVVFPLFLILLSACSPVEDHPTIAKVEDVDAASQATLTKEKLQQFLTSKANENYKFKKGTYTLYFGKANFEQGIDLSKAVVDDYVDSYRGIHSLVLKCASRPSCGYHATFDDNRRVSVWEAEERYFDAYLIQFRSIDDVNEFKKLFQDSDFSEYLEAHSVIEEFGDRNAYSVTKWEESESAKITKSYKKINRNDDGSLAVSCLDGSYGTITKPTSSICVNGNGKSDCKASNEWTVSEAADTICS